MRLGVGEIISGLQYQKSDSDSDPDVSAQSQILNLLIDFRRGLGLTYILISHNLAVVDHLATHISVMYLGRTVESARSERLFESPRHPSARMAEVWNAAFIHESSI